MKNALLFLLLFLQDPTEPMSPEQAETVCGEILTEFSRLETTILYLTQVCSSLGQQIADLHSRLDEVKQCSE
jgi:hypothetical protein